MTKLEKGLVEKFNLHETDLQHITNVVTTVGRKLEMQLYLAHTRPDKGKDHIAGNNSKKVSFLGMGKDKFLKFREAVENHISQDNDFDWEDDIGALLE